MKKDLKYQILYFCDDSLGMPDMISKKLKINESEIRDLLSKLIKQKLVIKYEKEGDYFTTELGKIYLKNNKPQKNLFN